jgi:hypothetical protein
MNSQAKSWPLVHKGARESSGRKRKMPSRKYGVGVKDEMTTSNKPSCYRVERLPNKDALIIKSTPRYSVAL